MTAPHLSPRPATAVPGQTGTGSAQLLLVDDREIEAVKSAVISGCGTYRYLLGRSWGRGKSMLFVMLNPSTADASVDDPTIRRCVGFAKREGCGFLQVVNLFAYRATDPDDLLRCPVDAVGPDNFRHLRGAAGYADVIVAAWGAHQCATTLAIGNAKAAIRKPMLCLGVTKSGAPRHPLYVKSDAPLEPWPSLTASTA